MVETAQLEEFLSPYPEHVLKTMLEGRAILLDILSPVVEWQIDATTAVCDGFAYFPRMKTVFVNLAAFSDHVTLVFGYGAALDDKEGRLKGEGKQVRHKRIKDANDLCDPYIVDLIHQASARAPRPDGAVAPSLVVKVYEGPKRRPNQ